MEQRIAIAAKTNTQIPHFSVSLLSYLRQKHGCEYGKSSESDSTIDYYLRVLAEAKRSGDKRKQCGGLCMLGNAYGNLQKHSNFLKTLQFYTEDLALASEIVDNEGVAMALSNDGKMHLALCNVQQVFARFTDIVKLGYECKSRDTRRRPEFFF